MNETLDDKVSKFTLNIPNAIRSLIDKRKIDLEYRYLSDYVLDLIELDLENELLAPRRRFRRIFELSKK